MEQLIRELITQGVLKSKHIINAFRHINRIDFVPTIAKSYAYINEPISIGYGQTISQPLTVAFMLELLSPQPGQKILDIGSGSGWQTALLSYIVSHDIYGNTLQKEKCGKIIGIELISELAKESKIHISKYNFIKKHIAEIHCLSAQHGFPKEAPFSRIIAAASAKKIPSQWKEQLEDDGVIIAPIGSSIVSIKKEKGIYKEKKYKSFAFVPFIYGENIEKDNE